MKLLKSKPIIKSMCAWLETLIPCRTHHLVLTVINHVPSSNLTFLYTLASQLGSMILNDSEPGIPKEQTLKFEVSVLILSVTNK